MLASASPVIVQSAVPEVIKSLPPVNVANWPGPDFVAWLTLGVAIATLLAVGVQIRLAGRALDFAREELKATNDTLDLAKDELSATNETLEVTRKSNELVQESLRYAREQSDYLTRRANLHVFANELVGFIDLYVANYVTDRKGKSARGAVIQILFEPGSVNYNPDSRGRDVWKYLPDWWDGTTVWKQCQVSLDEEFFPGSLQFGFKLNAARRDTRILWRALYHDGLTPNDGTYTPLETLASLDRTRLLAGIPPLV